MSGFPCLFKPSTGRVYCPNILRLARREGFEPSDPISRIDALAVRSFRPLRHHRIFLWAATGYKISYRRHSLVTRAACLNSLLGLLQAASHFTHYITTKGDYNIL